jgi:hypothetical protein
MTRNAGVPLALLEKEEGITGMKICEEVQTCTTL